MRYKLATPYATHNTTWHFWNLFPTRWPLNRAVTTNHNQLMLHTIPLCSISYALLHLLSYRTKLRGVTLQRILLTLDTTKYHWETCSLPVGRAKKSFRTVRKLSSWCNAVFYLNSLYYSRHGYVWKPNEIKHLQRIFPLLLHYSNKIIYTPPTVSHLLGNTQINGCGVFRNLLFFSLSWFGWLIFPKSRNKGIFNLSPILSPWF